VLSIRSATARFSGEIAPAISLARQALDLLPETEVIPRAGAILTAARAYQVSGDVTPAAEDEVAAAVAFTRTSDNSFATMSSICLLARLQVMQGRLHQAAATYAQVVQVVPRLEVLQTMFTSLYYYFGLGDLLREWNDLDGAERYLAQGMALVNETLTVELFMATRGYTALARLQQARGNAPAALETLDALAHLAERRHFPPHLMTQGDAVRAQLELAQGNLSAAINWADASELSTEDDDLSYPREAEYLVLARVRIAQARDHPQGPFIRDVLHLLDRFLKDAEAKARIGSVLEIPQGPFIRDVLHLLDRFLKDAEAKARIGSVLEILVLCALALEAQGVRTSALSTLERALVLAAPEGYIRLFVDEGAPMRALLRHIQARSKVQGYVADLLVAFGEQHPSDLPLLAHPGPLAESLTEREREVLGLLLEGASNHEIARRLVLSVNTVKRHVYNLCGKLGVQSRTQAIVRARTLNLL
jgi:LuxR family maltose regulon positive regulatory protein